METLNYVQAVGGLSVLPAVFFLCDPRALAFDDPQSFSKCHLFTVTILNFIFKSVLTPNNLGLSRTFSFCIPNMVD